LAGLSFVAHAADSQFDKLDVNGDGFVSPQEALALKCLARNYGEIQRESKQGLNRHEFGTAVQTYCSRDLTPSKEQSGHVPRRH